MQRPGGRTARVRAAVHRAVLDLIGEHPWQDFTVPQVADRSGVHQATIYRRWGTVSALLNDVVSEQLAQTSSLPETGSLHDDLHLYAAAVAASLEDGLGMLILRGAVLELQAGQPREPSPVLQARQRQLQAMLDSADARGERPPTVDELVELVLAPMYFHALFTAPPTAADAARLVDRLLRNVDAQHAQPASAVGTD